MLRHHLNDRTAGTRMLILSTHLKSQTIRRLRTGIMPPQLTKPTLHKRVPAYNSTRPSAQPQMVAYETVAYETPSIVLTPQFPTDNSGRPQRNRHPPKIIQNLAERL